MSLDGMNYNFKVNSKEFLGHKLAQIILREVGPRAVINDLSNLRKEAQKETPFDLPKTILTADHGLTKEGNFVTKDMLITPSEIIQNPSIKLDLSQGQYAKSIGFKVPDRSKLQSLGGHIQSDFLKLHEPEVMFPLMGHICLAPFTSAIGKISGKQKYAMHLRGLSGCGKTFLGKLALSFFGDFGERFPSWASNGECD